MPLSLLEKTAMTMTIHEMQTKKRLLCYTYKMISMKSGVPVSTIQKIFSGETETPHHSTLCALEQAFTDEDQPADVVRYDETPEADTVCESEPVYNAKKQGEYTLDDYYALPDERRVELIDGYFYDMSAPTPFHQLIAGEVYRQISNYVLDKGRACMPLISPVDVRLDRDNKTMVEPDVLIICHTENDDRLKRFGIYGAPDFVLEVTSPSTKARDYGKKLGKYIDAGVREYWIVNPYQKHVLVYYFASEVYPVIYGLDADIPVGIYDGDLTINLSRLIPTIERLISSKE